MSLTAVLGVCIIAAAIAVMLKSYNGEYSLLVSVTAGAVIIIALAVDVSQRLLELRNSVADYGTAPEYFFVALKALGICVITGFISDACRDAGQSSLASKAELAGRCAIFILSVPMLLSLFDTAYGFVK